MAAPTRTNQFTQKSYLPPGSLHVIPMRLPAKLGLIFNFEKIDKL